MRPRKWGVLALLLGGILSQTIVCNVPDIRLVTDDDDDFVIIEDRYYYDDCCYDDGYFFDFWW